MSTLLVGTFVHLKGLKEVSKNQIREQDAFWDINFMEPKSNTFKATHTHTDWVIYCVLPMTTVKMTVCSWNAKPCRHLKGWEGTDK